MNQDLFFDRYFLKINEILEAPVEIRPAIFEAYITKKTARTFKRIAVLKFGELHEGTPPAEILQAKLTLHNKRVLQAPLHTLETWIQQGWVIEEVRFHTDGQTVKEAYFRMGISLYTYFEHQKNEKNDQFRVTYNKLMDQFPKGDGELLELLQRNTSETELKQCPLFPTTWPTVKRLTFLEFCVAFFQLVSRQQLFDFKEIGATYFNTIGGSKVFDSYKKEFIAQLEQWFDMKVSDYGLVSLGQITPLFFSGQLEGNFSSYKYGSIHALTDHDMVQDHFTSACTNIWLVENRAILTRMSTEMAFLQRTNSFVLSVDGQLRTAHKTLIRQLMQSTINVFIWTDYDAAGLSISRGLDELITTTNKRFIARDQLISLTFTEYEEWLTEELQIAFHEQEQQLGDVAQWTRWMKV
ncbi:DUF2399 domain-containing protein [Solibacillus sp. FSL K6-1523]|uniref:DUF2399 domain-containing protein n=1 Tax=Solibacillus sp. FSL K6-1523 TaxID=2921471 RepID=UPI0030F97762